MLPPGTRASLQEISSGQHIPPALLSKLLQKLVKRGVVRSFRGFQGGYALARPPEDVSLRSILEEIDGPLTVFECLDHPDCCTFSEDCGFQSVFWKAQQVVLEVLQGATVADCIPVQRRDASLAP